MGSFRSDYPLIWEVSLRGDRMEENMVKDTSP